MTRPSKPSPGLGAKVQQAPAAGVPWLFLITLMLAIAVVIGPARFAYGLLLPPMREDLNLTYLQAGLIGTASFVGYLLGSVTAPQLTERFGLGRANALALGLTTLVVGLTATTLDFWTGALWRLLAGVTSGWIFVVTSSLVISRAPAHRTALYTGLVYGGGGIGTIGAGVLVPLALLAGGESGWRWGWVLLALVSGLVTLLAVRERGPALTAQTKAATGAPGLLDSFAIVPALARPAILSILAAYFLFAAGYIIYGTFFVAFLLDRGLGAAEAGGIWSIVGVSSTVSGVLWGALAGRLGDRRLLAAAALLIEAISLLLPVWAPTVPIYYVSALGYGLTLFGVPSLLMSFTRTAVAAPRIPQAVGLFTIVFSLGQMSGPTMAGLVIDRSGDMIGPALVLGGALLIGGAASLLPFLGRDRVSRP